MALLNWCMWTVLMFGCVFASEEMNITAGQDITLLCQAPNSNIPVIEWRRSDLSQHVLVCRDGKFVLEEQHPSFKNRVDLQDRQMKDGDVSLILTNVTINDTGTYECRVIKDTEPMRLIKTIYLSVVDPPAGQSGGLTEDGGKKNKVSRERPGLAVFGFNFVVMLAFAIFAKWKMKSQLPPPPEQHLV